MDGSISANEALEVAKVAFSKNFNEADFGFVAGSIMREEGTTLSDIDLVVIYKKLPNAYRKSFTENDIPVEAFVHDPATLRWFMHDDVCSGYPALPGMVAEGATIGPRQELAETLRDEAQTILAAGPPALDQETLDRMRYEITDKVDDLRGQRTEAEFIAIGTSLYAMLADFILLSRGAWSGKGKWVPRRIAEVDTVLAATFVEAFNKLFCKHEPEALINLAKDELSHHGGFFFDGYYHQASAKCRMEERSKTSTGM